MSLQAELAYAVAANKLREALEETLSSYKKLLARLERTSIRLDLDWEQATIAKAEKVLKETEGY